MVVGCAALARELRRVLPPAAEVHLLPAALHNRPERIPAAVAHAVDHHAGPQDRVLVAYADCGTGGALDAVLAARPHAQRLPGAHCYELVAGSERFAALAAEEPGTFFLTEFLARHAEQLVVVGLGLDRHPELRDAYFGHYRRVVLLAPRAHQPDLEAAGRWLADRLGLAFEVRVVGDEPFARTVTTALAPPR